MRGNAFFKVFKRITDVVAVLAVIFIVIFVGGRLLGFRSFVVLTGSMEPVYPVGSVIVVRPATAEDVSVGDAITFNLSDDTVATHRVVEKNLESRQFVTQGDQSEFEDAPISFDTLIGKPMFAIPYLGYAVRWILNPPGRYIMITAIAILVILCFLPDIFRKKDADSDSGQKSI